MRILEKPRGRLSLNVHDLEVVDTGHIDPDTVADIRAGKFEKQLLRAAFNCVEPGDRIVEIGAGTGIVGAAIARRIDAVDVRAFETLPANVAGIKSLYKHNKLARQIKVENKAIVSDPKALKKIALPTSDDSSALSTKAKKTTRKTIKKTVGTIQYEKLCRDFVHNVLIVPIDGDEVAFLKHAALDDVDLIIVKVELSLVGREGLRKCREYLGNQGFIKDSVFSTQRTLTYKRPNRMYRVAATTDSVVPAQTRPFNPSEFVIDPRRSLLPHIVEVDKAVLAHQPGSQGWRISASVFDADKNPIPEAVCWHGQDEPSTQPRHPPRPRRLTHLPGTWLFGGCYNPHFGHFLVETMSRVWALDHIDEKIEGVLFFPVYGDHAERAPRDFENMFSIMDREFNWKIVDRFYEVDKLIVPPQGSGFKFDMASAPEYRDFMRNHMRADLEPIQNDKLYVSRSQITDVTGRGLVGEKKLERYLEGEGYVIFHPQNHSFEDQLRHYKGARHILGPDGSPFHLANLVGDDEKQIGIMQRRLSVEHAAWQEQIRWFDAGQPLDLARCKTFWAPAGVSRAKLQMSGEIQFSKLCSNLKDAGLISSKAKWPDLTKTQLKAELIAMGHQLGADMHQVHLGYQSLRDYPVLENGKTPQVYWHAA